MDVRSAIFNQEIPFEEKAAEIYRRQTRSNPVYKRFTDVFGLSGTSAPSLDDIPLLPIRAFKEVRVVSTEKRAELLFRSSGTGRMQRSIHEVLDPRLYEESVLKGFDRFYSPGSIIRAYTPRYEDNPDSSLVWMLKKLIDRDRQGLSRFLPTGKPLVADDIREASAGSRPLILFGAAFGLVDLAEMSRITLPEDTIVIETGGMKTERREIGRGELHRILAEGFGLPAGNIHSEYGMCELLSQAYAAGDDWFESVPWMRVTIRDADDPLRVCSPGEEGLIGVIDLANLYSCSFVLTEDKGVMDDRGRFKVAGRWNPENLRGCNFLIDRG